MYRLNDDKQVYTLSLDAIDIELLQLHGSHVRHRPPQVWDLNNLYTRTANEYYEFEISTENRSDSEDGDAEELLNEEIEVNLDLDTYIQMLKVLIRNDKFSINVCGEQIQIQTVSGARVSVPGDHFLGLARSRSQCLVCRRAVTDAPAHALTARHMTRLAAILTDQHCIRQIDDIFNHCVLCNEIIENSEIHICSDQHRKNVVASKHGGINIPTSTPNQNATSCNKASTNQSVANKSNAAKKITSSENNTPERLILCHICNIFITNTVDDIKRHESGYKHNKNLQPNNNIKNKQNNATTPKNAQQKIETKSFINSNWHYCSVCKYKVTLKSNVHNIEAHEKGGFHKQNLKAMNLNSGRVSAASSQESAQGMLLSKNMTPNNPEQSKEIQNNWRPRNEDKQKIPDKNNTNAKTASSQESDQGILLSKNMTPINPKQSKEIQNNWRAHNEDKQKIPDKNNTNAKTIICTICKRQVPNNPHNKRQHDLRHEKEKKSTNSDVKLQRKISNNVPQVLLGSLLPTQNQSNTEPVQLIPVSKVEKSDQKNIAIESESQINKLTHNTQMHNCHVCEEKTSDNKPHASCLETVNSIAIATYLDSEFICKYCTGVEHTAKELVAKHKNGICLKNKTNDETYKPTVAQAHESHLQTKSQCNTEPKPVVTLEKSSEYKNIAKESASQNKLTHDKLEVNRKKTFCSYCDINVDQNSVVTHYTSSGHLLRFQSVNNQYIRDGTSMICKICRTEVPYTDINVISHLSSTEHKYLTSFMMSTNDIIQFLNAYSCKLCKIEFYDLADHIESTTHGNLKAKRFDYMSQFIDGGGCVGCKKAVVLDLSDLYGDLSKHVNSATHKVGFAQILQEQNILKENDLYNCELCNDTFEKNNVISHIDSITHKRAYHKRYKKKKSKKKCCIIL